MITIKVTFENATKRNFEEVSDFLRSMVDNGQVIEFFNYPQITSQSLSFPAFTFDLESCSEFHYNTYLKERLIKLTKKNIFIKVEQEANFGLNHVKKISKKSDLFLMQGGESPIKEMNSLKFVPLFLLPPISNDNSNYFDIICWERNFSDFYSIWRRGNISESYFFKQLTHIDSALSKSGLSICKRISDKTGQNCYYFFSTYGEGKQNKKTCPKCSKPLVRVTTKPNYSLAKCNKCLIVTEV